MAKDKQAGGRGPRFTPPADAARRAREAKLADALRANLARRKADLAERQEGGGGKDGDGRPPRPRR